MRNAEPQTKSGGNNKWVKIHKPIFDGHITNVESPRIRVNQDVRSHPLNFDYEITESSYIRNAPGSTN